MEYKEIVDTKQRAEAKILEIIESFAAETGVTVDSIDVSRKPGWQPSLHGSRVDEYRKEQYSVSIKAFV